MLRSVNVGWEKHTQRPFRLQRHSIASRESTKLDGHRLWWHVKLEASRWSLCFQVPVRIPSQ